jgi:hypothetical protein
MTSIMNVNERKRQHTIQVFAWIPKVAMYISNVVTKLVGNGLTQVDIAAAERQTSAAVMDALIAEIAPATHPGAEVWCEIVQKCIVVLPT